MRLVAFAVLTAALAGPALARDDNPSAADIERRLTRGIVPNRQAPAPAHPDRSAPVPPPASEPRPTPAGPPSVNLVVQFRTGSAELTPAARRTLDELGRALSGPVLAPYRFRIEGHTDTVGDAASNRALSERRAAAVAGYLNARFGIDRARLEAVGMGEDAPLVSTGPEVPEPRNRRVQVVNLGA